MNRTEIKLAMHSLKDSIDAVIRESPGILPEKPSTSEVSAYAAAMNSLSFALTDISRAIVHIDEMEGGCKNAGK